jgi:hypothetical protein
MFKRHQTDGGMIEDGGKTVVESEMFLGKRM